MRPQRTKAQVADSRRFILDTARRLYARRRVEEVSMDDIARTAGYTRRTLYAYFTSADEIRLLILLDDLKTRWALQQTRMAHAETGLAKIIAWGQALFEFSQENPHATQLQAFWDYRGIDRRLIGRRVFRQFEKINNELAEGLRTIFALGIRDGSVRPDISIDLCISQFLYSLRGIIHRALLTGYSLATFDPDEYVNHFFELFSEAIGNPKGQTV